MKQVVGIAGTDEKCRWVESLGADVCINYKSPTFEEDLVRVTPNYVEVYFGKMVFLIAFFYLLSMRVSVNGLKKNTFDFFR